jgi:hypothetical protein
VCERGYSVTAQYCMSIMSVFEVFGVLSQRKCLYEDEEKCTCSPFGLTVLCISLILFGASVSHPFRLLIIPASYCVALSFNMVLSQTLPVTKIEVPMSSVQDVSNEQDISEAPLRKFAQRYIGT